MRHDLSYQSLSRLISTVRVRALRVDIGLATNTLMSGSSASMGMPISGIAHLWYVCARRKNSASFSSSVLSSPSSLRCPFRRIIVFIWVLFTANFRLLTCLLGGLFGPPNFSDYLRPGRFSFGTLSHSSTARRACQAGISLRFGTLWIYSLGVCPFPHAAA